MAQTKKDTVRDSILESARQELAKNGYAATTMRAIARRARVSPSNLYVYFPSKLELLFAIYDPWFRQQILNLEDRVRRIGDARDRLRVVISTLWSVLPAAEGAYGTTFVEGLAVSGREGHYSRGLLIWAEDKITAMIADCLPADSSENVRSTALAHILFMAFDGFAVNHALVGPSKRLEQCIDLMTDLLLQSRAPAPPRVRVMQT